MEPGLGAELRRGRGGASSRGAAGPVRPRTSPSPPAPPPRAGCARRLANAGERRSPLVRRTVGSAGGVRTQVPARAKLAALRGPAGPGTGPGLTKGPARPPGPAADQVGTGGRVGPGGGAGLRAGPGSEARAWLPSGTIRLRLSASAFRGTRGSQFPSRGRPQVPGARHTVGASPRLGFPVCEIGSSQRQPNGGLLGEFRRWWMRKRALHTVDGR